MKSLLTLYRRLDRAQQTMWFRITASVLALAIIAGTFGSLLWTSYSLNAQGNDLAAALAGQNLKDLDALAVSLAERGTVTVGNETYGGPLVADRAHMFFDETGAIIRPGAVASLLVSERLPAWMPVWLVEQTDTTWLLTLAGAAWLLLIVWMGITLPFILTLLGTAVPVFACWLAGAEQAAFSFMGIGLLTFTFVLLTRMLLLLYSHPTQVLAVAHTVLKEASRTRIALVFIVLLLVLLPLLPLGLDPEAPLRFRIQTFISRSLGLTFAIAACLTLFLSCATVAFEIRDRQIWQLVAKPMSRFSYLIGKWAGIMSVNLTILIVAGVAIFTFTQYLRSLPVAPGQEGFLDRVAVRDAVLTARVGTTPKYDSLTNEQVRARVEQIIAGDPDLAGLEHVSVELRRYLGDRIRQAYEVGQRTIPPVIDGQPQGRTYTFSGLGSARTNQSTLTLRYRFHILSDDEHQTFPAGFQFNGREDAVVQSTYVPTMSHVLPIGPDMILEDGTLNVTVYNLHPAQPGNRMLGSLNFEAKDFELLYKVGGFEANFVRAMMLTWVKLAFLAMLGISCATYLSFPVACLLSFTIFMAGTLGPYLALSLQQYYPPPTSAVDWQDIGMAVRWLFQTVVRALAQALVFALKGFGEYNPTQSLVEGRLIPWGAVAGGVLKLGVVWSGLALIVGYMVMRYRQLAIYSGHG